MIDFALALQLFVLINPFSTFPFLMDARTRGLDVRKVAFQGVLTAFGVAVAVALAGPWLFRAFGVSIDAFRVAGGIVVLLLGLDTIRGSSDEEKAAGEHDAVTTVLATPLLTGPATISFVTLQAQQSALLPLLLTISIAFVAVGAVFAIFVLTIDRFHRKLVTIVSRVLGLFLTAVAIQMIAAGVSALLRQPSGA
jgi:multiple antibiotic resistance protein